MQIQPAVITGSLIEEHSSVQLFGLPQRDRTPAAGPEEPPSASKRELQFPDFFPVYPFI
ncbi:hypothetical protein [Arthrobacter sp. OAP107]|uniref:hypothetical protein n=1 Tax=Arthrobacter sp. OAP107 TaxID=3156445 RepID=UPI0033985D61